MDNTVTEPIVNEEQIKKDILYLYSNQNLSNRKIANKVGKSTTYIVSVLVSFGVYKFKDGITAVVTKERKQEPGFIFVAKCKKTGKEFRDYENKSGILIKYLQKTQQEIFIPNSYTCREYFSKNGKFWHEQFFDIIKISDPDAGTVYKKCAYCEWETVDLNNKSGAYTTHLQEKHNKSIDDYVNEFPDEIILFKTHFENKEHHNRTTESSDSYINCAICNEKFRYITNTHLKKHDITPEEYKLKFPNSEYASVDFTDKTTKLLSVATKNIKKSFTSKPEKELREFIENDLHINTIGGDKKLLNGTEIDILIPSMSIGIEFNGVRYHSENYGKKDKWFHLNKTEKCLDKNYRLIHIFEDEWFLKNDIVKSLIKNIILRPDTIKNKLKYETKNITSEMAIEFLNTNHIKGEVYGDINLGVFCGNSLIAVSVINNSIQNTMEFLRFSFKYEYDSVEIMKSKIEHISITYDIKTIIIKTDRRWQIEDESLIKLGFKMTEILEPDYSYLNKKLSRYRRFDKYFFNIKEMFPKIYDESKTEWQMMQEVGFDRIWDCGKFKYEFYLI